MLGQCYLSCTEEFKNISFLIVPNPEDPEWIQFGWIRGHQIVELSVQIRYSQSQVHHRPLAVHIIQ